MPAIGRTEILLAFMTMVLLLCFWAMVIAWGWLIWRLLTGKPILPERPMVSRGRTTVAGGHGIPRCPWLHGREFLGFERLPVNSRSAAGQPRTSSGNDPLVAPDAAQPTGRSGHADLDPPGGKVTCGAGCANSG